MYILWSSFAWLAVYWWTYLCTVTTADHAYGTNEHFVDFSDTKGQNDKYHYIIEGDLNIGAVFPIHRRGTHGEACGTGLRETGVVQYVEALVYAINEINADPNLLPGYTLGTVVLDDCDTAETALGQALHFIPLYSTCDGANCSRQHKLRHHSQQQFTFYDVVGVIGSESSDASMMIANVLGLFDVPQISSWATSDLLSNKVRYPYFMRMVPPDR